jgi:predicted transcriptional regulator
MSAESRMADIHKLLTKPDQLSASFHMVNRLLPDRQEVMSVPPEMPAREALAIMHEHSFAQLPVMKGRSVLGLFTYRAFALESLEVHDAKGKVDVLTLPVEEFLEHDQVSFARLTDEFRELIEVLDKKDSVVVSGPEDLVAILTPMDVLKYLYSVANAFVLIEEIELALRALIGEALDDVAFHSCVKNALSVKHEGKALPASLENMTFDDYVALIRNGRNWIYFEDAFGGTRDRARARLEPARDLRNDIFHFRRELSAKDHEALTGCRNWLLRCVRKVKAESRGAQ